MSEPEATAPPPPVEKPKPSRSSARRNGSYRQDRSASSSKSSQTGQTFVATLAEPVSVKGRSEVTAGRPSVNVVTAKAKGKIKGEGQPDLSLTSISVGGHTHKIQTAREHTVKGKGKRTAATTGGGAAGGALIGGIAGGGKVPRSVPGPCGGGFYRG